MPLSEEKAKEMLRESGLRATVPRVAVLRLLSSAEHPLSHTEVVERLGRSAPWDRATTFRNLIKLKDAGLAPIASRIDGIDRYALASRSHDGHQHPHFKCEGCGQVSCLPVEAVTMRLEDEAWGASLRSSQISIQGECPSCLSEDEGDPERNEAPG